MCADGVDLGRVCRLCGRPLVSCEDDGQVSWHESAADAVACAALAMTPGDRAGAATSDTSRNVE